MVTYKFGNKNQYTEISRHNIILFMGKGDKKTKRGKIIKGSFGVRRPRKKKNDKKDQSANASKK